MDSPEYSLGLRSFSTASLREPDKVPFWRDVFADVILRCDIEVDRDRDFSANAKLLAWPGLHALWSTESAMHYSRSKAQAVDGDDWLVLLMRKSGTSRIKQRGHELSAGAGEAIAFLGAEAASADVQDIDALNIAVPCSALRPMVDDLPGKTMRLIPSDCEALTLLASYAEILRDNPPFTLPEVCQQVERHIQDLVAMVLGATSDAATLAQGRGIRAARMRNIKADILANICDPALKVETIALRQKITPRYIQMLFEDEDVTFSQYVLAQRLDRAYHLLRNSRTSSRAISEIAYSVGFGDQSYFNRTFRRRFGASPSEIRTGFVTGTGNPSG